MSIELDIPESSVKYHVMELRKKGIIKREGTIHNGHWIIVKTEDSDGKEIEDNMCNLGEGVYERGIEQGQHKLASLFIKMDADGRIDEYRDAVINEDLLKKLLSEYGLD